MLRGADVAVRRLQRASNSRLASLFVVTSMILLMSACSAESTNGPAISTALTSVTPATSSQSPSEHAQHEAVAAYVGMWQAMADAATTSDWKSPKLAQYAVEPALGVITRSLYTDHINGVISKGNPVTNPTVSSVDLGSNPALVKISDCADTSNTSKVKSNGEPYSDSPGGHRHVTADVAKQADGSWKVTRFNVEAVGSCN